LQRENHSVAAIGQFECRSRSHIADVRGDKPEIAEGIANFRAAVAVRLISRRLNGLRAGAEVGMALVRVLRACGKDERQTPKTTAVIV